MSTNTALDQIKNRVEGHTEGPWVYHASINRVEDVPEFDLHRFDIMAIGIAKVEESDADGELIAAAPKLLAALEAVEAKLDNYPIPSKAADPTGAVISALEGLEGIIRSAIEEALR